MNQKDLKLYVQDLKRSAEFFDKEPKKFDDFDKTKINYIISLGKNAIEILKAIDNNELSILIKDAEKFYNEKNKEKLLKIVFEIGKIVDVIKVEKKDKRIYN